MVRTQPLPTPLGDPSLSRPPLVTRAFGLLVTGHFLQALGHAALLLLPVYLSTLGASRAEIGTIMGTAALSGLLFRPIVGLALDRVGRRPVILVGTLFLASGVALIGAVDRVGPLVYIARLLSGVGSGALLAGYFTLAADIVPIERRTEGIALFGVSGLVPMAVNPLVDLFGVPAAQLHSLYPWVAVVVLSSGLAAMALPETRPAPPPPGARRSPLAPAIVGWPLWPVWTATVVFGCLVAGYQAFATVAAARAGVAMPSQIWLAYGACAVLVRVAGPSLPDRLGPSNLLAPALATYCAAYLLAASGGSGAAFLISGALAGIGHGYCFPVLTSQVVSRSPNDRRGVAVSGFTALWELSALIAPPILGLFADLTDDAVMFAGGAMMALVGLSLWALLEHVLAPRPPRDHPPSANNPPGS